MVAFLLYQVKVAALLAVFFLLYRWLLSRETFHGFNRVVLITIAVLSFVLPLFNIRKPENGQGSIWLLILFVLYWIGFAFILIRKVLTIVSMARIIQGGRYADRSDGCDVIESDRIPQPLNWMRYIVMPQEWLENVNASVWKHESFHAHRGHSLDLLLADIVTAFQWFNPISFMQRKEFELIHEFEADRAVIDSGADAREYKRMLVSAVASGRGMSMTNWLRQSSLKERIDMMDRKPSNKWNRLKALFIPVVAILFLSLDANAGKDNKVIPTPRPFEKHVVWIFQGGSATVKIDDAGTADMKLDQVPGYLKDNMEKGISRITLRYMYDIDGLADAQPLAEKISALGIKVSIANNDEMLDRIYMPEYRCARIYDEGNGQYRFVLNTRSSEENRKIKESGSYSFTDENGNRYGAYYSDEKYESPIRDLSITGDLGLMKKWIGMFDGHGVAIYPVNMPYTDAEQMARAAWKRGINQVSMLTRKYATQMSIILIPEGSEWSGLYPGMSAANVLKEREQLIRNLTDKGTCINGPKVFFNSNTQDFGITNVVRAPDELIVIYQTWQNPDKWLTGFNSMELLAGDRRYRQTGNEGLVGFEKAYFWSPDDGIYLQTMHFEPIPDDVKVVDIFNKDVNATVIKGLQVSDDLTYYDNIRTIQVLCGAALQTTHVNEEGKDVVVIERIDLTDNETTVYLNMKIRQPHSFMGYVGSDFVLTLHDGREVKPLRYEGVQVDKEFYRNGDHIDTPFQIIFPPLPKDAFNHDGVTLSGTICHEPIRIQNILNSEIRSMRTVLPRLLEGDQDQLVSHMSHYVNLKALLSNIDDRNLFGGDSPYSLTLGQRSELLRRLSIKEQDLDRYKSAKAYIIIYKNRSIYIAEEKDDRNSINYPYSGDVYEYLRNWRGISVDDEGNWYVYGNKAVIWEIE